MITFYVTWLCLSIQTSSTPSLINQVWSSWQHRRMVILDSDWIIQNMSNNVSECTILLSAILTFLPNLIIFYKKIINEVLQISFLNFRGKSQAWSSWRHRRINSDIGFWRICTKQFQDIACTISFIQNWWITVYMQI